MVIGKTIRMFSSGRRRRLRIFQFKYNKFGRFTLFPKEYLRLHLFNYFASDEVSTKVDFKGTSQSEIERYA